jgi:ABC-2 type transport system permease protein
LPLFDREEVSCEAKVIAILQCAIYSLPRGRERRAANRTFAASLVLAFLIYFGIAYLLGLGAFWMRRITGLRRVRRTLIAFLGGSFIPLAFFPAGLQAVSKFLPFEYARSVPILIYLQRAPLVQSLLIQLVWVAVLYTIIHFVTKRAVRRFVSVGL